MWTRDLTLVNTWQAHENGVYALTGDPGRLFTSSCEGEIKEWDPDNGQFRQMTVMLVIKDGIVFCNIKCN